MNHSDCKIHYASKQKRIIALQNNRQKPAMPRCSSETLSRTDGKSKTAGLKGKEMATGEADS